MTAALAGPLVLCAFLVDRLRQLPGAPRVARFVPGFAWALILAAIVVVVMWMGQRSPQQLGLADLAANRISTMQSWIIVSGDISRFTASGDDDLYLLTD